jgi:hypothetical protein
MKVSNIKCKPKDYILTMEICGSYMHEFSTSKDMEKHLTMIKVERRWQ